ncbi:response regulator transcription factor [Paenibacillus aceris]|uniref:Two-component system response regulator YesN n=1 Tax=Paenibacillus aceris TaxID=869555 RepID=A0ABS4I697_9BACL|nr:response regulator transcription factor [Paenibacillus aceris]MBP1966438.1 two-component system response regulator YesN [Paenibacillus aceris]NHW39580.1 response regulator transcription factor [Paenibacillus aceris]
MWKVAIVDDDPNVLRGMRKIIPWAELDLEFIGEEQDGQKGLELIRATCPDIVITDIYMPVLNGLDMIEKLREEGFQGKIIILSGYSDFEYARQAVRLDVDDYLSKPTSVEMLHTVMKKMIHRLEEEVIQKEKMDEVYKKLLSYEPFVTKEWIKSIVDGTYKESVYHERLLGMQPDYWLNGKHLVIGIEILRDQRSDQTSISDWNLLRFSVGNVANEVLQKEWPKSQIVELQTRYMAIILHGDREVPDEINQKRVNPLCQEMRECVERYVKVNILIGIGHVKDHWQRICESKTEAFLSIQTQAATVNSGWNETQLAFYHDFAQAIRNSKSSYAKELVNSYIVHLRDIKLAPEEHLQQQTKEMWTILAYTLFDAGVVLNDIYPTNTLQNDLDKITSVIQFELWLNHIIDVILESRKYKDNLKHQKAMDTIIAYIHEHYTEEISLEELADIVSISKNYLCYIFKKVTGETFNQYLTRVRIEKAKEMILDGKWLVYEIAEKVGYKNIPYFSTLFKKITGHTPTDLVKN